MTIRIITTSRLMINDRLTSAALHAMNNNNYSSTKVSNYRIMKYEVLSMVIIIFALVANEVLLVLTIKESDGCYGR